MAIYLPPELVKDILTRLPIESLVRCTCVCKAWSSLITSSSFNTEHMIRNKGAYQLVRYTPIKYCRAYERPSIHRDNQTFDCCSELGFPQFRAGEFNNFMVIDVCNGLVCFSYYNRWDVVLWNPSIRKLVRVSSPAPESYHFHRCIGFGFNPQTNDYKLVSFFSPLHVAVYDLSTTSWRKIDPHHLSCVRIYEFQPQALFNGVIHWLGCTIDRKRKSNTNIFQTSPGRNIIVSFHMETDVFGFMLLPDAIRVPCEQLAFSNPNVLTLRVAVYGDSLSLIHSNSDHSCCVWVMKEYGISESWTKQFTIDMKPVPLSGLVGFRANGDVLLHKKQCKSLISYNPQTKQVTELGIVKKFHSIVMSTFVPSLALLEGFKSVLGSDEVTSTGEDRTKRMKIE